MPLFDHGIGCECFTELLSPYLDHCVAEEEKRKLEEHLAQCPRCKRELEELRVTVRALGELPIVPVPRSFVLASRPRKTATVFPYLRNATLALAAMAMTMFAASLYLQAAPVQRMPAPSSALTAQRAPVFDSAASPVPPAPSNRDTQQSLSAGAERAVRPSLSAPAAPQAAKEPVDEADKGVAKLSSAPEKAPERAPEAKPEAFSAGAGAPKEPSAEVEGYEKAGSTTSSSTPSTGGWPLLEMEIAALGLLLILATATVFFFFRERRRA